MQQKQQMAVAGSIDEMSQRLNLMKNAYRALSTEQRNSAFGANLLKEIQTLDPVLKTANAALGDHQRNVGNYGSAISGFANKAWGGIRKLAYALPGIGIAGIMGEISTVVKGVISTWGLFKEKSDETKMRSQSIVEVNKASAASFAEQSVKLTVLKDRFLEAGASAQQKKNVMIELNKEFGDYGLNLKSVDETEDFLVKKTPAFLKMLDTKAKATAAFSLATDLYKKALVARAKGDEEYVTGLKRIWTDYGSATMGQGATSSPFYSSVTADTKQAELFNRQRRLAAAKERDKEIDENMRKYKVYIKQATSYEKQLANLQRDSGMTPVLKEKVVQPKNVLVSKPIDFSEDQRKADDNLLKESIESQKETLNTRLFYLKQIISNEDKSYEDREAALAESIEIQKQLIDKQGQIELTSIKSKLAEIDKLNSEGGKAAVQAKLNEISQIEKIEEKKRSAEQKTLLNSKDDLAKKMKLLIEEAELRAKAENLIQSANNEKGKIQSQGDLDKINLAVKNINDEAKKAGVKVDTQAIDDELEKLIALHEEYRKGKKTLDEYNRQKGILHDTVTLKALEEHGKILEIQRNALKSLGKDTDGIDKQIAENNDNHKRLTLKTEDEIADAKWVKTKKTTDDIVHYTREAAGIISDIMNNRFTAEKNAIQDVENAQQQSYAKDVENIEKSSASEQDKANKLKILESKRQAQKEANAREQRRIDVEKAKFDKAQAILNIILNTASAVVAQLSIPGAGIGLAAAAGAIGAAQLAVAAAAPLPKYEKGRNGGPAEWALTDEKGPELYIEPDGRAYMGNNGPTMRFLQAGTKIIPADQINNYSTLRMLAQLSAPMGADATSKKIDELKDIVAWQTNKLASAYNERKAPVVNIINQGQWNDYINRSVKN